MVCQVVFGTVVPNEGQQPHYHHHIFHFMYNVIKFHHALSMNVLVDSWPLSRIKEKLHTKQSNLSINRKFVKQMTILLNELKFQTAKMEWRCLLYKRPKQQYVF